MNVVIFADRFRPIGGLDQSIVKPLRTLGQILTVFAKTLYQIRFRLSGDIANGMDANSWMGSEARNVA